MNSNPFKVAYDYLREHPAQRTEAPQGKTVEALEVRERETIEALAASIFAEVQPDEAGSILAIWEEVFGMTLDRERVAKHLEHLRQWRSQWTR